MTTINLSFDAPEEALQSVGETPEASAHALRLAAAMFWYGRGEISMGTAAKIAGLDLTDFLLTISRHKQDIFHVDIEELKREIACG